MSEETQQMFLAKALYDNIAETPDELAFRRGDVLTVVEQDTSGLDGWWLCSLRGRKGIAPGNRLKILSGMIEGMPREGVAEQDVAKSEWRRSGEQSPNKVITPVKKGDVYLYNQPNRTMEDYDVPPSRYFPASKEHPEPGNEIYDVPTNLPAVPNKSAGSFYDTPPSSKRASSERTPPSSQRASMDSLGSSSSLSYRLSGDQGLQHLYQTPPSSKRASAESGSFRLSGGERHYDTPPSSKRSSLERILSDDQPTYDTPTSGRAVEIPGESTYDTPNPSSRRHSRDSTGTGSRGSMLSSASMESCLSGSSSHLLPNRHSNAASLPDSARSSLDASLHEPYDLPPRETRALKQLSMDSGLGSFYDTPAPGRQNPASPQPQQFVHSSSHLQDLAKGERPRMDMKRSRSVENALDDFYDSPRNNAPKVSLKSSVQGFGSTSAVNHDPNAVYDIPPQVTRDSVISARSDSSDENLRLSTCSVDSRGSGAAEYSALAEGIYEELLLDLDSAVELLVKLQQEVTRAASKLLTFVSSTWRSKESLQRDVYEIKVACVDLKKAMAEFMEFAQGTLANSARLSDRKLVNRLIRQVTPLQQLRKTMSEALHSLEDMKWQVALLSEPLEPDAPDHLGAMISMAKDLIPDVKKLASLIQGNSTLLFKRSSDMAAASSRSSDNVASKPPIGPKPELLARLGTGGGSGVGVVIPRARTVQQRPLPPPPLSRRPLPPTPLEQKLRSLEISGSQDSLNDYVNVMEENVRHYTVADDDDDGDRDYSDLQQEYDYVQLEECDTAAQQKSIDQQQQQKHQQQQQQSSSQKQAALKNIEEEAEPPSTPTPEKGQCSERIYESPEKDLPMVETKPDPVHRTERVSADLGEKHPDIDMVPTKDDSSETISPEAKDIPDGLVSAHPGSYEDLQTPVNSINGFKIPSHPHSPSSIDLSGTSLDSNDKQVLCYYSGQLETHVTLLTNAIDAFFACIENSEPPKVFISNSKFVIVTAHKLVYISDALHRSLINKEVKDKVMHCANHVCECLKVSVQATKTAALQYPSVPAVQEMVDRVVDVSHAAHELKLVISQASTL